MGMKLSFYKGKSVFVTGHTGFKGGWLCRILINAGAAVSGYALEPESGGVFETACIEKGMKSYIGDIRDKERLTDVFRKAKPEIVFHLAAQPLVLDSYERPAYTFETNVMGTVNLLECVRLCETVRSVLIVTTDKVYKDDGKTRGYVETDPLGGYDPYAASKACAEIVSGSYRESFLSGIPLTAARAGNVIGGGDVSANRIIPDCLRAVREGRSVVLRNPNSVRPFQHVLEPLFVYLDIAARQYENPSDAGNINIGPDDADCITAGELANFFCSAWGGGAEWMEKADENAKHESNVLRLDCSKLRSLYGVAPVWNAKKAVEKTVEWEKAADKTRITDKQIEEFAQEYC
jgi:CDP-glucose 4,6-dehydratase